MDYKWDTERFENWFRTGVQSYVLETQDYTAFPGAAQHVARASSLAAGLRSFADTLDSEHLTAFKQAVSNTLSSLEPKPEYIEVARQILSIAAEISAYQILQVIPGKIGNGWLGALSATMVAENNDSKDSLEPLIGSAVQTVSRLSTPGRTNAVSAMKQLLESPYFPPAYAGMALAAMCAAEPEKLLEHLEVPGVRYLLEKQFSQYDDDVWSVRKRLADLIYENIGFNNFIEALQSGLVFLFPESFQSDLDFLLPESQQYSDAWLSDCLFDETGPLKILYDTNTISIIDKKSSLEKILRKDSNLLVKKFPATVIPQDSRLIQSTIKQNNQEKDDYNKIRQDLSSYMPPAQEHYPESTLH